MYVFSISFKWVFLRYPFLFYTHITFVFSLYFWNEDYTLPHLMLFPSLYTFLLRKTSKLLEATGSPPIFTSKNKEQKHSTQIIIFIVKTQMTSQAEKQSLSVRRIVSPRFSQHIVSPFSPKILLTNPLHTTSCPTPF